VVAVTVFRGASAIPSTAPGVRHRHRAPQSEEHQLIDNLDLATVARELADRQPVGTLDHSAATSVAITCATTRDAAEARAALGGITPEEVRQAAIELFERLSAG
jgi:hypothetical protein